MAKLQFMHDIETLGSGDCPTLVTIGSCAFYLDDEPGTVLEKMEFYVDVKDATDLGMVPEPTGVMWWMAQSDEARGALVRAASVGRPLAVTMTHLANWIRGVVGTFGHNGKADHWSHPVTFDMIILTKAYELSGIKKPWGFRDYRDTRTLITICQDLDCVVERPRSLVPHVAVEDAVAQAKWVQLMYQALRDRAIKTPSSLEAAVEAVSKT